MVPVPRSIWPDGIVLDCLQLADFPDGGLRLADFGNLAGTAAHGLVERLLDLVAGIQCLHPARQVETQLLDWELIEHSLQNLLNLSLIHLQAVDRLTGHMILLCNLLTEVLSLFRLRICGVHQD